MATHIHSGGLLSVLTFRSIYKTFRMMNSYHYLFANSQYIFIDTHVHANFDFSSHNWKELSIAEIVVFV